MNLMKNLQKYTRVKLADKSERCTAELMREVVNTTEAQCRTGPGRSWVTLPNYRSPQRRGLENGLLPPLSHHSENRNDCCLPEAWLNLFHIRSLALPYCCRNLRHIPLWKLQERLLKYKMSTLWKNSEIRNRKNVINNNNRTKNHAIILIDANKTFSTIQYLFMIKILSKVGIKGNYFNLIKGIYWKTKS